VASHTPVLSAIAFRTSRAVSTAIASMIRCRPSQDHECRRGELVVGVVQVVHTGVVKSVKEMVRAQREPLLTGEPRAPPSVGIVYTVLSVAASRTSMLRRRQGIFVAKVMDFFASGGSGDPVT